MLDKTIQNESSARNSSVITFVLLCVLLLAASHSGNSRAADFQALIDLRAGAALYHQKRFADAEVVFQQLYDQMSADELRDRERYALVIDFLAQSKSLQGKNHDVVALMEERLSISQDLHGETSELLAPMQAGVAEAYYRDGMNDKAIAMVERSIANFRLMDDPPEDYMNLAQVNLDKYRSRTFDHSELPMDLSEFYTQCERIGKGDSEQVVKRRMRKFVEVDVDFKPEGFWGMMYQMAADGKDGYARSDNRYRRLFIPATAEAVRRELCVVDQLSGIVISADNTID